MILFFHLQTNLPLANTVENENASFVKWSSALSYPSSLAVTRTNVGKFFSAIYSWTNLIMKFVHKRPFVKNKECTWLGDRGHIKHSLKLAQICLCCLTLIKRKPTLHFSKILTNYFAFPSHMSYKNICISSCSASVIIL